MEPHEILSCETPSFIPHEKEQIRDQESVRSYLAQDDEVGGGTKLNHYASLDPEDSLAKGNTSRSSTEERDQHEAFAVVAPEDVTPTSRRLTSGDAQMRKICKERG